MKRLYFAYGSNMHPAQMQTRCHGATALGAAYVDGWAFQLIDNEDGRWVYHAATMRVQPGSRVYGVVWEVTDKQLEVMDKFEGWNPANPETSRYRRDDAFAVRGLRKDNTLVCTTYVDPNAQSGNWDKCSQQREFFGKMYSYRDLIVGGARLFELPENYIEWLEGWTESSGGFAAK